MWYVNQYWNRDWFLVHMMKEAEVLLLYFYFIISVKMATNFWLLVRVIVINSFYEYYI